MHARLLARLVDVAHILVGGDGEGLCHHGRLGGHIAETAIFIA